jgi:hypothetical protein
MNMKTRTLELQELSLYNLPIDGTHITFFDSSSSFGMFEQHYTLSGEVEYLYGDIAESLEEALKMGGVVVLGDTQEDDMTIPITCGDHYLTEGTLWMYDHNYYPVLDKAHFPFQTQQYYEIAIREGWCKVINVDSVGYEFHTNEGHMVEFNDRLFEVEWIYRDGDKCAHLHQYELIEG